MPEQPSLSLKFALFHLRTLFHFFFFDLLFLLDLAVFISELIYRVMRQELKKKKVGKQVRQGIEGNS
jgi:hypothetical protein